MIPECLGPLAQAVATGYGIDVVDWSETTGGQDSLAKTYKATSASGELFFVKLRTEIDPGIALCAALRDLGVEAVLAPIKTNTGGLAQPLGTQAVLVYPFKEGYNGFERALELHHWRQIGEALRQIHDAELPGDVLTNLSRERFEVDGIPELELTKARLLSSSAQTPAEAALVEVIRANLDHMAHIIERTQELGNACRDCKWELVPCHADLHVGNVLVDTTGFVNLIDWDGPRLAPRECDLLFFCDGGILDAHGTSEEASFFSGYGSFESNRTAMAYYRYARALEDLVAYAREATDANANAEDQIEAVKGFEVQFRARKTREGVDV